MAVTVLMVAEKPSLAASIAGFLSDGASAARRGATDVHEWDGAFRGEHATFKVCAPPTTAVSLPPIPE